MSGAEGDEDGVDDVINIVATEGAEIVVMKISFDPLYLAIFYTLDEAVVQHGIRRGNEFRDGSDREGPGASRASQRVRANDQMNMLRRVDGSQ